MRRFIVVFAWWFLIYNREGSTTIGPFLTSDTCETMRIWSDEQWPQFAPPYCWEYPVNKIETEKEGKSLDGGKAND